MSVCKGITNLATAAAIAVAVGGIGVGPISTATALEQTASGAMDVDQTSVGFKVTLDAYQAAMTVVINNILACNGQGKFYTADVTIPGRDAQGCIASEIPTGAVMAMNAASCPAGWSTLPAAEGRTIIGAGSYAANTDADGANSAITYAAGATGGNSSVVLAVTNLPPHQHATRSWESQMVRRADDDDHSWIRILNDARGLRGPRNEANMPTTSTGSAVPFDAQMPYLAMLYCVKN